MAGHDYLRTSATERWLDAHQREQIAARHHSQFELGVRRGIGREPDGHIRERGQAIEALTAIADVDVIAVQRDQRAGIEGLDRRPRPDAEHVAGPRDRKRPQQERVGEAENGAVGADANREREHSDDGEGRARREHTEAVPDVLPQARVALQEIVDELAMRVSRMRLWIASVEFRYACPAPAMVMRRHLAVSR
jgi:hypothetical protein